MFKGKSKKEEKVEEVIIDDVILDEPGDAEEAKPLVIGEVAPEPETVPSGVKYNGATVVEKLEIVNGDGRLCLLNDGTTAYVPLHLLGEEDAD